jgi:hypothetical protein
MRPKKLTLRSKGAPQGGILSFDIRCREPTGRGKEYRAGAVSQGGTLAYTRLAGQGRAMPRAESYRHTAPNQALEPTANSVGCAPAVGGGSPPAFGNTL